MKIPTFKNGDKLTFSDCTLAYGHFDLVHPGHIRYLRHAASQGENLVIALLPDTKKGENKSYQFSQLERADGLAAFALINGILLLDDEENALCKAVETLNPKLLIFGKEFEKSADPEINKAIRLMKKKGRKVKFYAGDVQYASTSLLEKSKNDLLQENRNKFIQSCQRQKIKLDELLDLIKSWDDTKLLVIGDAILDQYAGCEAIGMSAEAPVLVVRELQKKNYVGGASIVASHIKALGAKCNFLSVVGNDKYADILKEELTDQGINCHLIVDNSRPTTFKKRYVVENQKLFRVSRLNDHLLDRVIENQIIKKLEEIAPNVDGIVVSDFVYGVITPKIIKKILKLSKKHNLKIFGDIQCSSQIGMITKFNNFSLLCPNEREARIALQDKDSGLEILSNKLISHTNCERLIMKLGPQGFIAYDKLSQGQHVSQSFPTLSVNPLDVSGAGDSLLAIMAIALCKKNKFMHSAALACCMASIAVENMGNQPINRSLLIDFVSGFKVF
ncbi:adenylyltransferase/cytidyltransferase family protein [Prochlorococcus marinus XMU1412]|uniref:PfkB family carbohydrate kinase n=1 Tax=Prochlorococcus marinus TaxID=1219 RepID=UPI001ADBB794|nr:PfkB family carbohydrate kinase [Prochlorococcus marinus]MBO8240511.1 adenylyltransferase/cytidyltransferase family protein [Prochlorococcus marinus XMU1412]MBW3071745.1 ADP-heptose synthase [Prochlorococcus marinus str. MU1412]